MKKIDLRNFNFLLSTLSADINLLLYSSLELPLHAMHDTSINTVALEVTRHASSFHAPFQWLSSITPVRLLLPLCVVTPLTVLEPPSFQRLFVVAPVTLFLPPCVVTPVASSVLKPPFRRRFSDASLTSVRRHASHYHGRSALVWAWLITMRMRICA